MTDSLRHRGPDDGGYYVDENVALGHRRLSIIDLSGGHQPMWNQRHDLGIVFNGEIYNFLELRPELEKDGFRFTTQSDTEVLLALYEKHGEAMLEKLNGMFAFALWNARKQSLFLARDRAGKKPLYYARKDGRFLFASEAKALLRHPSVSREMDRRVLAKYLAYEYIPAPDSIFRDIRKLPGAHAMTVSSGAEPKIWRYWHPRMAGLRAEADFEDSCARVEALLEDAVVKRLISDVPVGVFLSGGIDSSAVVAMMARHTRGKDIKTFCIGFRESSFDESVHARRVAGFFGTDHHEDVLDARRMTEILPDISARLDEPFADPSIVPTYLLSKFTRRHVTVALGGDGGDELFAGYPTFAAQKMAAHYRRFVPRFMHQGLRMAAAAMLVSSEYMSLGFRVKRFLGGMEQPEATRHFAWLSAFSPEMQRALWNDMPLRPEEFYAEPIVALGEVNSDDPLQRAMYQYFRLYLQDDILVKVDRASMMHSLEVRAPFLDVRMVDAVFALPSRFKIHGLAMKFILKRILSKMLPKEILSRPKQGFAVPVARWFREDLRKEVKEVFGRERIRRAGFFCPDYVERLVGEHQEGRHDHCKPLWTLYMFEKWRETWLSA